MLRVPVTVSFDALDTLIRITHGIGFQYRSSYAAFLREHGVDLDASCPNATCDVVARLALEAIHSQVRADRANWTRSANPREMPIGGDTDEELRSFWTRVVRQVYRHPSLCAGAAADVVRRIEDVWATCHDDVRRLEDHVLFHQFASTSAYSWYPEGLHTLQRLRDWGHTQSRRADTAPTPLVKAAEATAASPVLVLAAPPFVVSNVDPRIGAVFAQLDALATRSHDAAPPLLSRVISARDVGYAKPSPLGILAGVRDIAAAYRAACEVGTLAVEVRRHVHVGDAEADRMACERAGCHYVQCDPSTGATWGPLHAKLLEIEAACGAGTEPAETAAAAAPSCS
ncbi:hypothetical protein NESM_000770500 [Novymonas esmeraldas]|uniref:Haloacid dehalogenase-like hydrolase n=1 Tax=Novymonas esmeraldas TaxID=1808958 RepID=A0AAW0EYC7_9TRYP